MWVDEMVLQIKAPILGFETLQSVVIKPIDTLFSTLHATNEADVSFTVANPYALLGEYDFEIPDSVKMKLQIDDDTQLEVFCMLVAQNPIEKSMVNFLAPIVINRDKKLLAQVALNPADYPNFSLQEPISNFIS